MMKKTLTFVSLAALVVALAPGLAVAQGDDARVDVLISFKSAPSGSDEAMLKSSGARIKYSYNIVPAVAANVPLLALQGLSHNPRIDFIEPDGTFVVVDAELDNTWGVKRVNAGDVHSAGNTGLGVKVAVIDTGIDYNHPDLAANYAGGWDFVNNDNDPMDDNSHGTHVAGTVAAVDDDAGVVGAAPSASIYALKVLGPTGSGSFSAVIAALDWAADSGIQVTNNSYGSSSNPGTIVQAAFDNTYNAGMLHVAAAGNSGNCSGNGDKIGYPAKYTSVMA